VLSAVNVVIAPSLRSSMLASIMARRFTIARSRAGPEVRPAFCVLRLDGGNFRNDLLRRLARIFRLRHRSANGEVIKFAEEYWREK
jgi:hypothetical protein